jgi:O-antigen/teichoic acid export membrane protein
MAVDIGRLTSSGIKYMRSRSFVTLCGLMGGALVMFVLDLSAVRIFGMEAYGEIALALNVIMFFGVASQLGFRTSIIRIVSSNIETGHMDRALGAILFSAIVTLGVSLFLCAVGVFALYSTGALEELRGRAFFYAMLSMVPYSLLRLNQGVALAFDRAALATLPASLIAPLLVVIALVMFGASSWYQPEHVIASFGLFSLVILFVSVLVTALTKEMRELFSVSPSFHMREWLRISFHMWLSLIMVQLFKRSPLFIIGVFASSHTLASFALAQRFSQVLMLIQTSITWVMSASISRSFSSKNQERLDQVIRSSVIQSVALSILAAITILAFTPFVLDFAIQDDTPIVPIMIVLAILLVSRIINSIFSIGNAVLQQTRYERAANVIDGVALLASTAALFAFIPIWGAYAAATIAGLTLVARSVAAAWFVRRKIGYFPLLGRLPREKGEEWALTEIKNDPGKLE